MSKSSASLHAADDQGRGCGGRTNLLAGRDQFSWRSLAVAAMRARHVIGNGRMAAPVGRTGVAGDPLPLVEMLTRILCRTQT